MDHLPQYFRYTFGDSPALPTEVKSTPPESFISTVEVTKIENDLLQEENIFFLISEIPLSDHQVQTIQSALKGN
jgi:hypothetical protein